MKDDPIVEEVRKHREAIFAKYNYDLDAMCEDLNRQVEQAAKRGKIVTSHAQERRAAMPATKKAG